LGIEVIDSSHYPARGLVTQIRKLSGQLQFINRRSFLKLVLHVLDKKIACCLSDDVLEDALKAYIARLK
jgi:hypothetical protein